MLLATEIVTVSDGVAAAAFAGAGGEAGPAETGGGSCMAGTAAEIVVMAGHLSIAASHKLVNDVIR